MEKSLLVNGLAKLEDAKSKHNSRQTNDTKIRTDLINRSILQLISKLKPNNLEKSLHNLLELAFAYNHFELILKLTTADSGSIHCVVSRFLSIPIDCSVDHGYYNLIGKMRVDVLEQEVKLELAENLFARLDSLQEDDKISFQTDVLDMIARILNKLANIKSFVEESFIKGFFISI